MLLKWWWKLETSQEMNVAMDYWEDIQNLFLDLPVYLAY
jgi:hypothetical protein